MQAMGTMGMPVGNPMLPGQKNDNRALFKAEKENLEVAQYKFELEDIEQKILDKHKK